ncbi:5-formyltetrahydrofolate cyclo-ligase-like [Oscarella lobularis]|uniref:5-formyltetrahydrofolate cyclo-ligase-like n=1 Tax=Oscarella lobularis TaxID=121494 RepID=UPI0033142B7E
MDMVQLHSWEDYLSLPVTKWNIKQPAVNDASRADALDSGGLDLVVTPGLGFTKDGLRLGRGKGYYDAFLAKCAAVKIPKTIGLAFSVQLCENIPVGPKDIQIDKVLYQ